MPNIASILKEEIARVARKEVRRETTALKKSNVTHRSEIAALKRRATELERQLRAFGKNARPGPVAAARCWTRAARWRASTSVSAG